MIFNQDQLLANRLVELSSKANHVMFDGSPSQLEEELTVAFKEKMAVEAELRQLMFRGNKNGAGDAQQSARAVEAAAATERLQQQLQRRCAEQQLKVGLLTEELKVRGLG